MSKAIRIHETGGPEVMQWEDVDVGPPEPGMVTIAHRAAGLNYMDTYYTHYAPPAEDMPAG